MPFSHHSHSGQFCGHAANTLEEVVQEAITKGLEVFCMTEHMPRDHSEDLYAEEIAAGLTPAQLNATFEAYKTEARRLQEKYRDRIRILVGLETEWIRPQTCNATIQRLLSAHDFDMLVGSVHHVHTIPIDFSQELYDRAASTAAARSGVSPMDAERALAADYFDLQYDMLTTLRPPVVGHFDLIRLLARFEKNGDSLRQWPEVWDKVKRNLAAVKKYGGCLEINSAGLRKGLREPYPCSDICKVCMVTSGLLLYGSLTLCDRSSLSWVDASCSPTIVTELRRWQHATKRLWSISHPLELTSSRFSTSPANHKTAGSERQHQTLVPFPPLRTLNPRTVLTVLAALSTGFDAA